MKIREVEYPVQNRGIKFMRDLKRNHLNFFVNLMLRDGAYSGYKIFKDKILLLNDANAIRHIFATNYKNYHKSKYNEVLKPVLGVGIFMAEDQDWWRQRQEAAPIFSTGNFPEMTQQMVAAVESMFKRWNGLIAHKGRIDLYTEMMWLTLDVALRSFFHQQKEEIGRGVQENLGTLLREAETRIWSSFSLPHNWIMKLPRYKKPLKFMNDVISELINARQESGIYPDDLLTRAIKASNGSPESRKVLQDKVMSYLTSGHETTANAMTWTWVELAQRPEILSRMTEEVDQVTQGESLNYASAKKLTYTQQIFSEAMRLYPPVWTMSRVALQDDVLPLDDGSELKIHQGDTIMMSPYVVHRRNLYWKDPTAFDPCRFDVEQENKRPKFAYFPFGGGARLCLGFRFAQIEAAVTMAMIVQRYHLSLVPGQKIQPVPMITLRSDAPIWFNIERRHDQMTHNEVVSSASIHEIPLTCPFGGISASS